MRGLNDRAINRNGSDFDIEREGAIISRTKGFFCGNDHPNTIQLLSSSNIEIGDYLIHTPDNRRYQISEIRPLSISNSLEGYMAIYKTPSNEPSTYQYNIGTINGSAVVGNQHTVTLNVGSSIQEIKELIKSKPEEEQVELNKLIQRLEIVMEDNQPISKGFFAKFSNILAKHSDIAIALGSSLINWLTNN